ncbi:MAG: ParB/RepB/Spo0J family partition protein [bacterium]|nr:ParB/RepB/Spo0J family partition protein [bacterium]
MESNSPLQKSRSALGRGLRSLIPPAGTVKPGNVSSGAVLEHLLVEDLVAGENQPRTYFEEQPLQELADSVATHGILQPLVVRRRDDGQYEIVAGERRWRAAKIAGLKIVPCIISGIANRDALTVALVENLQREDLNVMEEAESYRRLSVEVGLTQDEIAKAVGKDRTTIANVLRLLKLPETTQKLVIEKRMSMGHARALLALRDVDLIQKIADQVAEEGMSVRRVEELVNSKLENSEEAGHRRKFVKKRTPESAEERQARRKLEQTFGTKVEFKHKDGKGVVLIHFSSLEQLSDILERVDVSL